MIIATPQYQNSVESRLQMLENENIKRRLDLLEMQIKGRPPHCMSVPYEEYDPDIECPKCQYKINKQPFLGHGRASQLVHHTNSQEIYGVDQTTKTKLVPNDQTPSAKLLNPNLQTPDSQHANIGQMTELTLPETQSTSATQNPLQRGLKDQTLNAKPPNPNLQTPNLQHTNIGQKAESTPAEAQAASANLTSYHQQGREPLSNQTKLATPNLAKIYQTDKIPPTVNMQPPDINLGNRGLHVPPATAQIVGNTPQRHSAHPTHPLRLMQNLVPYSQVPGKQDRGPPLGHAMYQKTWPHMQPLFPSQNPPLPHRGYMMPQMGLPIQQPPTTRHKYIIPVHQTTAPNYNVRVPPFTTLLPFQPMISRN